MLPLEEWGAVVEAKTAWRLLVAASLVACGSGQKPDPTKIQVSNVCGSQFTVRNGNPVPFELSWRVEESGERGKVSVSAAHEGWAETTFTTRAPGTVVIWVDDTPL